MVVDKEETYCSTSELARVLGITGRRIQQLVKDGLISQVSRGKFRLAEAVQAYIRFIGNAPAISDGKPVDGKKEKALLTKAQREKAELEVAVLRGELHRGEDVRAVMNDMIAACRAKLMSLPTKIAPRLLAQSDMAVVQDIVKHGIYEALLEVSTYDPVKFNQRNKKVVQNANTDDNKPV